MILKEILRDYLISLRLRKKYNTRQGASELADQLLALIKQSLKDAVPEEKLPCWKNQQNYGGETDLLDRNSGFNSCRTQTLNKIDTL